MKMLSGRPKALALLGVAAACLVADQATKMAVRHTMEIGQVIPVTPFFNLRHVFNMGGAFSIFYGHVGFLAAISVAVAAGILVYAFRHKVLGKYHTLALGILLGGTVGNLIDRLAYGRVTDFLDVYVGTAHWPTFNIADICINLGVLLLLITQARPPASSEPPKESSR